MSTLQGGECGSLLGQLSRAVERLSWSAERQRAYLADLGVSPMLDELALEFDEAWKPVQNIHDELGIDTSLQRALSSIDAMLMELTEGSELEESVWDITALDTDKRWLEVRRLAQRAHFELEKAGVHRLR